MAGGVALLAVAGAGLVILAVYWPFTRADVTQELQQRFSATVRMGAFHSTYFPPGCVAENVTLGRGGDADAAPPVTARKLIIRGSFIGMFRHHLDEIRVEGLQLRVPPGASLYSGIGSGDGSSKLTIGRAIARDSWLEFEPRQPGAKPLRFAIHELTLSPGGQRGPVSFRTRLLNAEPPGEIIASGKFGPWRPDDPGETPVAGSYVFRHAILGTFHGIAGTLDSQGKFGGALKAINVQGSTETPDFEVTQSGHKVQLNTQFWATVNGLNGDTILRGVQAHFESTDLTCEGSVAGEAGQAGKVLTLRAAGKGRIQDLLRLLGETDPPPMSGAIQFTARVIWPPGPGRFITKVNVLGDFGIDGVRFSGAQTQANADELSARARGEKQHHDAEPVISALRGQVLLQGGAARFSNLIFTTPGALAKLDGAYSLVSERVNLRGTLRTEATLSQSTKGVKSVLLKPLDPLFKRKHAGAVVGVTVRGTYDHPLFGISLDQK